MNALIQFNPQEKTMSSREIADLVESRHEDVKRSIDRLVSKGVIQSPPLADFKNINNVAGKEYLICKRDSYIIVAQLSPAFTAKLVDYWQASESNVVNIHTTLSDPSALRGLLLTYAEKVIALENKIESDAPKVEFHDKVCEAVNGQTIQEVAKVLGTGQNRLFQWLRNEGLLMTSNQPYQEFIDRGYFRVIQRQYTDHRGESNTYTRTLVTGKGLSYVQKRFMAEAA